MNLDDSKIEATAGSGQMAENPHIKEPRRGTRARTSNRKYTDDYDYVK